MTAAARTPDFADAPASHRAGALDAALDNLADAMAKALRASNQLDYLRASRAGLLKLYAGTPLNHAQAALIADHDKRIAALEAQS